MKKSKNKCIGVVVKNPNGRNSFNSSLGNIFASFAATIPQKKQYRFDELIALKKSDLIALAKEENTKIWLCWSKAKISNTIIGAQ